MTELTADAEPACEWCGGECIDPSELENGKCQLCRVQDCTHYNRDVASYDLQIYSGHLTVHMVCLECEICWDVRYQLDNGNKSKYRHEDLNSRDIND